MTRVSSFPTSAFRLLSLAVLVLFLPGCAAHRFVPPAGTGDPAPEAASAWAEATTACRQVTSLTVAMRISGRVDGDRIRSLALDAALTTADEIRLRGVALGRTVFLLAGRARRATMVIEDGAVTAPAEDIVEALAGVRLAPRALLAVVSGCVSATGTEIRGARRHGEVLAVDLDGARAFVRSRRGRWEVIAGELDGGLGLSYDRITNGWPGRIRVTSDVSGRPTDLTLVIEDRQLNRSFAATVFALDPPSSAATMTLDELRRTLRERRN
jgi:hypothetical protein